MPDHAVLSGHIESSRIESLLYSAERKNMGELISRGKRGNGRITERKPHIVEIPPTRWTRQLRTGKIEDHEAAKYVADDVGRPPVHFPEAAGFTIHQVEAKNRMLVQNLLAHVQPDQVEEASFDSSLPQALSLGEGSLDPWKKSPYRKNVQIARSLDIYSFTRTGSEILALGKPFETNYEDTLGEGRSLGEGSVPFQTIDQNLPHSIPKPGAVGIPEIKQTVKHLVVADLPSSADCLEEPGDEPDSESEAMDISSDEEVLSRESGASLESHTEIASADSHGPRTKPSRKRSAFYDDDLFAQMRSYVNQQIEVALLPLMNALRSRDEDEHKHRQKMLALEQEKLALMRQKLERTRRRSNAVPASVAK